MFVLSFALGNMVEEGLGVVVLSDTIPETVRKAGLINIAQLG